VVTCRINNIQLDFWIDIKENVATVMVKKHTDTRPLEVPPPVGAETYPIVSVDATGKLWRHKGLPSDWGFMLTVDRKLKEIK
jgi:hypothetical protein